MESEDRALLFNNNLVNIVLSYLKGTTNTFQFLDEYYQEAADWHGTILSFLNTIVDVGSSLFKQASLQEDKCLPKD